MASNYTRLAGTSMAAPHVAGVAALVVGNRPSLSNEDVRQVLHVSADDVGPAGFDPQSGYGRVNADRAVTVTQVPLAHITSPQSLVPLRRESIAITGSAGGPGFVSYQLLLSAGYPPTSFTALTPAITTPVTNGTLAVWNAIDESEFPTGWYTILLRVIDDQGHAFEERRTVRLLEPAGPDELSGWPVIEADRAGGLQSLVVGNIGMGPGNSVVTLGATLLQAWSPSGQEQFALPVLGIVDSRFPPPDLADLNGDGDLEVVIATDAGLLAVDHGVPRLIAPLDAHIRAPIIVDDMNGDGAPWIVTLDDNRNIMVRDPAGAPYSSAWPMHPSPEPPGVVVNPDLMATGDLDGDGRKEIVTAIDQVIYAIGIDGTIHWTYQAPLTPVPFVLGSSSDIVLGDVDGDGKLNVVYVANGRLAEGSHDAVIIVLDEHGQLRGTWSFPLADAQFQVLPYVSLADLDGDGRPEIVLGAYHELPTLRPARLFAWHYNGVPVAGFPYASDLVVREPIESVMAADVDGDGRPDLVGSLLGIRFLHDDNLIPAWNGQAQLLPGWPRPLHRVDRYGPDKHEVFPTLAFLDLDGNGTLDLVSGIDEAEVHAVDLHVPVAPLALEWPMYRHDARRTARYEIPGIPLCGNGVLDPGEECDDGNRRRCDGCSAACHVDQVAVCGDRVVVPECGEECDDGNSDPTDGCRNDCTRCGNGVVTPPEECDDGNQNDFDGCTNHCTRCGNGLVTAPETCDDFNLTSGDCCAGNCSAEAAGNACFDDGVACTTDVCNGAGLCAHLTDPCLPYLTDIESTKLRAQDPGPPSRRKVTFASDMRDTPGTIVPPAPDGLDDPRRFGGAIEILNSAPGGGEHFEAFLPSEQWTQLRGAGGWRYHGVSHGDPVQLVTVQPGRIKVRIHGQYWAYTLDEPQQQRIALRLRFAQAQWCAESLAEARGNPPSTAASDHKGLFVGVPHSPPPATCPFTP